MRIKLASARDNSIPLEMIYVHVQRKYNTLATMYIVFILL